MILIHSLGLFYSIIHLDYCFLYYFISFNNAIMWFYIINVIASCFDCASDYYSLVTNFFVKDEAFLTFLCEHRVLLTSVECPNCQVPCAYQEDKHQWCCKRSVVVPEKKSNAIGVVLLPDYEGTFLEQCCIPPWKVLLFINHFLSHLWDHNTVLECLKISWHTAVDWHLFYSEACCDWLNNQVAVGDARVEVEIDRHY